ncbi:diacylglycerol kinase family protein [Kaistella sp. BT6-1-3]|uniref:Diacylglycerol kinase family protein n=1 Tax=Kaistella yananensis TaxID=2989820 RepID=A0ABT3JP00_9FLAO|nr:diacylglycerol kinase family protein [Kaistella yananensis]MCW4452506.1 diacylglycerol kinase family protein [Kaistella yananensis]
MRKPAFHISVLNSVNGIIRMLRSERNFQLEVLALLINIFLIVYLKLSPEHAAIILLVCFAVLSVEMLNTAIEKICDFVHPEFSEHIGLIKDIAAGAVLLLAFVSVIIALLIYPQYIFV